MLSLSNSLEFHNGKGRIGSGEAVFERLLGLKSILSTLVLSHDGARVVVVGVIVPELHSFLEEVTSLETQLALSLVVRLVNQIAKVLG